MWTYQFATLQQVAEAKGYTKFVSMQNHYNLIYREEEREMIRYCNMTGVGLIPVRPYLLTCGVGQQLLTSTVGPPCLWSVGAQL